MSSIDSYVDVVFPIECKGRDANGKDVLKNPVKALAKIYKRPGSSELSSLVECQYNTGGHGHRCKASQPEADKVGEGVTCPYSFDIPHVVDNYMKAEKESQENYATLEKENQELRKNLKSMRSKSRNELSFEQRTARQLHASFYARGKGGKEPCF
ncbi:MAG TPA: hypothetical protein VJ461_05690 [Candidatus Nanoarchaeia archaeon]|nr:hypothetical protein [Candidatus Nanoarchaeia archaeon]